MTSELYAHTMLLEAFESIGPESKAERQWDLREQRECHPQEPSERDVGVAGAVRVKRFQNCCHMYINKIFTYVHILYYILYIYIYIYIYINVCMYACWDSGLKDHVYCGFRT